MENQSSISTPLVDPASSAPATLETRPPLEPSPEPPKALESPKNSIKPQKVVAKKSKKPLLIALAVFLALTLVSGSIFYFFKFLKKAPEIIKNDVEFLSDVDAWEKVDAPTVIWSLRSDGTGELTTNKEKYYPIKWYLSNGKLEIDTAWLYELNDAFEITLNRETETPSFTVRNLADDTESTFVPLGTSEARIDAETSPESQASSDEDLATPEN